MLTHWLAVPLALGLDALLGETRRLHPLLGFGRMAGALERGLNGGRRWQGAAALAAAVVPFVALAVGAWWLSGWAALAVDTLLLYLVLGGRSLAEHAGAVATALSDGRQDDAREAVGMLVSRETAGMDEAAMAGAAVESVLENGSDAVFGSLFWFMAAGVPGAVLHRLVNTLDALWGYRTPRFHEFGWAAARLDDLLNLPPAALTAATYALVGRFRPALAAWRGQRGHWESPNAGAVMAAGAGALGLRLGGPAVYHGRLRKRPVLGVGSAPTAADIGQALVLLRRGQILWAVLAAGGAFLA